MVHFVIPEVDRGEVILVQPIPINPDDTLEVLEERVHATEHQIIVKATNQILRSL